MTCLDVVNGFSLSYYKNGAGFQSTRETTEDVDMDIRRKHRSDCEHVNVIRTSRVLSPDRTWPDQRNGSAKCMRVGRLAWVRQ